LFFLSETIQCPVHVFCYFTAIWKAAFGHELGTLSDNPPTEGLEFFELAKRQFNIMAEIRLSSGLWKKWPELFPNYREFAKVDEEVHRLGNKTLLIYLHY